MAARLIPIIIKVSGDKDAERAVRTVTNAFKQMDQEAGRSAQASSSAFSTHLSASFFADLARDALRSFFSFSQQFINESIQLAQDLQNALLGVGSIAAFKGINKQEAQDAVNNLDLVKSGIISVADASVALKNLLQAGFGLQQSITLIERFGDTAAFGKQAALSYGDAIRSATEGIKNQNSILVDNAGITKNIEVILRERGHTMQDLSDKVKGLSAREALYQGLLAESEAQLGDAAKLTNTYTGAIAAQDKAYADLQRSIGQLIITNPALIESNKIVTDQINATTAALADQNSESAKLAEDVIRYWAKIKANLFPFLAFWKNLIQATVQGQRIIVDSATLVIVQGLERAVDAVRSVITHTVNLFINGINLITDISRKLPAIGPGAELISALQGVQRIERFEQTPTDLGSRLQIERLNNEIRQFADHLRKANQAAEEGERGDARIDRAIADAEWRRNYERRFREMGFDKRESEDGLARANELANGVAGGGGKGGGSKKPEFTGDQLRFARQIVETGFGLGATERQILAALAAALVESNVRNLRGGHLDSRGLFQQRPSQGWGQPNQILSPEFAIRSFFEGIGPNAGILDVDQSGSIGQLAQRVQRSAFPRRYDQRLGQANRLFDLVAGEGLSGKELARTRTAQEAELSFYAGELKRQRGPITDAGIDEAGGFLSKDLQRRGEAYYRDTERRQEEASRRITDFWTEYHNTRKNLEIDLKNVEADIAQLRQQNASAEFTDLRRNLALKTEERDLTQQLQQVHDDIANGPYNESLRVELALRQDILELSRRDEAAIKERNRAQLELADATIYHAVQADAAVLRFLASQRSVTQVIADAKTGVIQSTFDLIDRGLDKATSKLGFMNSIVRDLLSGFIRLALTKFFQSTFVGGGGGGGGQSAGGGGGFGGFLSNLFGLLRPGGAAGGGAAVTPGFAGGPGAGGLLNFASGAAPGFLNFANYSSIGVPTSLSAQSASQGALSSAIQQAQQQATTSAAAPGGFSLSNLGASLPAIAPFLGAALGAQLGGQSRFGQILGAAGGAIFGAGALLGGGLVGLFTNPITAPIGIALLVGSLIIGRNSARRRDETTRNQAMIDALSQLDEIIRAVRTDRMDGAQGLAAAMQVRGEYVTAMSALRDSKTRRIALQDVYRLDLKIDQIRAASEGQQRRRDIERHLVPEFAAGGWVPYRGGMETLIKVRPGEIMLPPGGGFGVTVPGVDRGVDSVYTMARPGTRVVSHAQKASARGFAAGGVVGGDGGTVEVNVSLQLLMGREDASRVVVVGAHTSDGRRAVVKAYRAEKGANAN